MKPRMGEGGREGVEWESDWAGSAHQKVKPRSLVRSFVCRSHALAGESFKSPPLLPCAALSSPPSLFILGRFSRLCGGTYMG